MTTAAKLKNARKRAYRQKKFLTLPPKLLSSNVKNRQDSEPKNEEPERYTQLRFAYVGDEFTSDLQQLSCRAE